MTAVAVWTKEPSAKELLSDRVAHGWRPRPSPVADGPRVLGYAACLEAGDCA